MIATHSPNILDGMTGNNNVNIIRMYRKGDTTQFKPIIDTLVSQLNIDPLLSNLSILESIFYNGVILTEGDRDRLVYRAAYRSYSAQNEDYLFINTNGKQALRKIIPLLIQTNLIFRVVTDFDLILNKLEFHKLIHALIPNKDIAKEICERRDRLEPLFFKGTDENLTKQIIDNMQKYLKELENSKYNTLNAVQEKVRSISNISPTKNIKKKGIDFFLGKSRDNVSSLITDCHTHNLYIVPHGELESLIPLHVSKDNWLEPALTEIYLRKRQPRLQEFISNIFTGL